MCLILHCIFIDQGHDTFLEDSLGHHILTQTKQLVKDWEYLLEKAIGYIVDNAVQLPQEKVLEVRVIGLAILTLFNVGQNNV
jgi:hypothetical protein